MIKSKIGQRVKDCIYCGEETNSQNGDFLCTECHNEEEVDSYIIITDQFYRKVREVSNVL